MQEKKRLVILGSTGSIGTQTLEIVKKYPNRFSILGLAAKSNVNLLIEQAKIFQPQFVAIYDESLAHILVEALPSVEVICGMSALNYLATHVCADLVVSAVVGSIGIEPTLNAAKCGKTIALANKETLVAAGELIMGAAKENGATILPIDSEHSALFQCLHDPAGLKSVERLILTASGGPFRKFSQEELGQVTLEDALAHPTWKMGQKVTIDCSTLFNKGLEMIEAHYLFGVDPKNIEVAIHPQSLIHSMVEYVDGSIIAQMSYPDMRLPIQYALTYPERIESLQRPFDLTQMHTLQFYPPDFEKFKCLKLCYDAIQTGGSMPCFLNAANEICVQRFINKEILWHDIARYLEELMNQHHPIALTDLESVMEVDKEARQKALAMGVTLKCS